MDEDNSQQKRSGWPNPSRSDSQECASRTTIESEAEHLDPNFVSERIADATKDLAGIGHVPTIVQDTFSATNNLPSVSDTIDIFSAFLRPLKVFNSIADEIANVHPYAKVALGSFTCASKMILDQADHDVAISDLLSKISEVYMTRQFECGIWRLVNHWVPLSEATSTPLSRLQSPWMNIISCLVQVM